MSEVGQRRPADAIATGGKRYNNMKLKLTAAAIALLPGVAAAATATVTGSSLKVVEVKPDANTGLNNIFVVYDTQGCSLKFNTADQGAKVYRFSNMGAAYAEPVNDFSRETDGISVALGKDDAGYVLEENGGYTYYCWVTNYANHTMTLRGVAASPDQDCDYSVLEIEGDASAITYYTINGQGRTLSREITVTYTTEEFDREENRYVETPVEKTYESMGPTLSVTPPAYCTTYFTVSGDRFLREWNMEVSAESGMTAPTAVACETEAVQEETDGDEPSNVMNSGGNGLGGSAPANISFYAYVTEGVVHYEWQMSHDQEFNNPDYLFRQQDLDYTFNEEGTYYLRFIGSNAEGTCETIGETYTVSIGASALEIPNAFSPNGDGVNDVWKVSYRSLTEFHCEIFNRSGQKIYGFDDPSGGWDGTWHGKTVKPGVYFYVITATGADGQKYKKAGDINIIKSVNYTPGSGGSQEEAF